MNKIIFIVAGLLLSLSSYAQELVGNFSGNFAVSQGNATYNIPIAVAAGRGGMQPSIALNYNSAAGNGLLGIGWNISGLSSITRCGKTIAQDGAKGGVTYNNSSDRFCFNGQRLVSVGGNEYRTEIDSFSKIIKHTNHWQVFTKAGQVYEYGKTTNARVKGK